MYYAQYRIAQLYRSMSSRPGHPLHTAVHRDNRPQCLDYNQYAHMVDEGSEQQGALLTAMYSSVPMVPIDWFVDRILQHYSNERFRRGHQ